MENYNYIKRRVNQVSNEGYGLHLESLLSRAFDIFKKSFWQLSLVTFLYVFTVMLVWLSMFETLYGFSIEEMMTEIQENPTLLESTMSEMSLKSSLFYSLAFSLVVGLIAPAFAGINKLSLSVKNGGHAMQSDLFAYYRQPYFLNIFIYSFLLAFILQFSGFLLAQYIPLYGGALSVSAQIGLNVSLVLTIPFIVFGKMTWIEAMRASMKITFKNWFFLMFVLAIGLILSYLGVLLCGIGLFFTYPFFYVLIFVIYDDVIGFEEEKDAISEIGEI